MIMERICRAGRVAVAALVALAVISCEKSGLDVPSDGATVTFHIAGEGVKTTIGPAQDGHYPTLWTEADSTMSVIVDKSTNVDKAYVFPSADGKSAEVTYTLKEGQENASSFILVSPRAIGYSASNGVNILVPAAQFPTPSSADREAIVTWAATGRSSAEEKVTFSHFTSYGHFSILNLPAGAELISVTLTADSPWSGNWYLNTETGTVGERNVGKDITLFSSSCTDLWFACAPVDLGGKHIAIAVATTAGLFKKTVTIPAGKVFSAGHILKFSVDMSGISPEFDEKYVLTALEDIKPQDKVVITMSKGEDSWAMSNDKGDGNAPSAVTVTVSDNKIDNPGANLIWNVTSSGSDIIIFPDGKSDVWLYTTNANNGVRVGTDENKEWNLDACGYLKHKKTGRFLGVYTGNPDWRAYTSTSVNISGQQLRFFVKSGTSDKRLPQTLSFPATTYSVILGDPFTSPVLSGALTKVTYSSSNPAVASVDPVSGAITALSHGSTVITAIAEADVTYRQGQASYTLNVNPRSSGRACRGWFELPAQKDDDKNGIDDDNSDYYYSWTMRADAPKIRNFSSCYSKSMVHPVWVAAPLHNSYKGGSGRNDSYKPDPAISCPQSSSFTGYTRGHMVSSSERTVSKPTNRQVFYYSNIGAQSSTGFNTGGGAWNNLEDFAMDQYCADTLYQVVGCIFEDFTDAYGSTVKKKTGSGFQVPTAWYKVLLRTKKGNTGKRVDQCSADELQCAAFILAHRGNAGHKPCANDVYTVQELEALTGLTFFVNVPNAPKATANPSDWGL